MVLRGLEKGIFGTDVMRIFVRIFMMFFVRIFVRISKVN